MPEVTTQATAQRMPRSHTLQSAPLLAWLRMVRVVSRTQRAATDHLRQFDLTPAQFDVLAQVGATPGPSQQELADRLLVTQGNVCQLLDGLEKKKLVERRREGRSNRIFLTTDGQALASQAVPEHETWQAERMTALEEEEQRELLRLLRKLDRSQQ